ncbi:MAG: SUMF1/EgtB/PvdO family nonheme iron enzyme [Planctomycetes bacterium]|nr:SUMF1/EgtB/PvdO family nonheme iron enzyme [Planctomycetota bacterium]
MTPRRPKPANPAPERAPKKLRVFVVRDFSVRVMKAPLDELRRDPRFEIVDLGLDPSQGNAWKRIADGIKAAHVILACVDRDNANVGFEIGYAWGLGKPVGLACAGESLPKWLEQPPFVNQELARTRASHEDLASLLLDLNRERQRSPSAPPAPLLGEPKTWLLAPTSGPRMSVAKWCREAMPALVPLSDTEIPRGMRRVHEWAHHSRGLLWVLDSIDREQAKELRHGHWNAATAVLAGAAFAVHEAVAVAGDPDQPLRVDFSHLTDDVERHGDEKKAIVRLKKSLQKSSKPTGRTRVPKAATAPPPPTDSQLLADYRSLVASHHRHLVNLFPGASDRVLREVYVEVHLHWQRSDADLCTQEGDKRALGRASYQPADLLDATKRPRGSTGRWVVLGPPGSGKSTLCRQICGDLAQKLDGPIPVFLSLARFAEECGDPLRLLQRDLEAEWGEKPAEAITQLLREHAQDESRAPVWCFFDGLDEVAERKRESVIAAVRAFATNHKNAAILVTSRDDGYSIAIAPLGAEFQHASVGGLDDERKQALLSKLLGFRASQVWEVIRQSYSLHKLAELPFLLTLMARVDQQSAELGTSRGFPRSRAELYDLAVEDLLRREHAPTAGAGGRVAGVARPIAARALLSALSLELHRRSAAQGEESWSAEEIVAVLTQLKIAWRKAKGPGGARAAVLLEHYEEFGSPEDFLREVRPGGILAPEPGPSHGPRTRWKYLHKSLREYLAAEEMLAQGATLALQLATKLFVKTADDARQSNLRNWGEVFALVASLVPDSGQREQILRDLAKASSTLFQRMAPQVEGVAPEAMIEILTFTEDWDGNHLGEICLGWRLDPNLRSLAEEAIWKRIDQKLSLEVAAFYGFSLQTLTGHLDRARFFKAIGRPISKAPRIETVAIPPDGESTVTFWMGSAEGVGYDDERPRRKLTIPAFRMGATPVTEAEMALLHGGARAAAQSRVRAKGPSEDHPAVHVSWWEAWLFAVWVGGALPTEAQWECACRAGTESKWSFGDNESELPNYGWYFRNSGKSDLPESTEYEFAKALRDWDCRVQPVRRKKPNLWNLYDMHGNVLEWCCDWFGPYSEDGLEERAGPRAGADRVLRGGSYWLDADRCRSAYRDWLRPSSRGNGVGFRVCFPAAPAG